MALIAVAADKGSPGVTTASIALAAVWPRPVLLAECDPAGGDLVYRLPGSDGQPLDPRRGLLSLAVAARRGLQPHQVWEHTQRLHGGLDVLTGVTNAEQGAGLDALWASLGTVLGAPGPADVVADCGRIGADGPQYDLLAQAAAVVMITRASLGEVVRLRDRAAALVAGAQRRGRPGAPVSVVVIAQHKRFDSTLAEVRNVLGQGSGPVNLVEGLAFEPRSADQLSGQWGGRLDRSMLIRTTRQIAGQLAAELPSLAGPGVAGRGLAGPGLAGPGVPGSGVPGSGVSGSGVASPGVASPGFSDPAAAPAPVRGGRVPPPGVPAVPPAAGAPVQQVMQPASPARQVPPGPDRQAPPAPAPARLPPTVPGPAQAPPARRGRHAEPPAPTASPDPLRGGRADVPLAGLPDPLRGGRADIPAAGLPDPLRNGHADRPPADSLPPLPSPDGGW